ncbi:MAG: Abi family protein [Clostridium sp.]|uniref:Abi family protein n=1 Tax=Clostridium sp. TaxID=1506 RepID=UPI002FCBB100
MAKEFETKTIDQQINILIDRGIEVEDRDFAYRVLKRIGLYRILMYGEDYKVGAESYREGASFNRIYNIYSFDRELRSLIMKGIGDIEIAFRSYIGYTLSVNYGELGYTYRGNFINADYHRELIQGIEREKSKSKRKNTVLKSYNIKGSRGVPIMLAVEILPFVALWKLYSNLLPKDKGYIRKNFCPTDPVFIENWLHSLNNMRNECAHYGKIYKSDFHPTRVRECYDDLEISENSLLAVLMAMKDLYPSKKEWRSFLIELEALIIQYSIDIDIKSIGLFENWKEILLV